MDRTMTLSDGRNTVVLDTRDGSNDILVKLDGWYGGVGVRAEKTSRSQDGIFPSTVWREGRQLTISGLVFRDVDGPTEAYERMISGLFLSGSQNGTITVTGSNGDLSAFGLRLDGEIKVSATLDAGMVEFEIPVLASDPYLYGPLQSTSAATVGVGVGLQWDLFQQNGALFWGADASADTAMLVNRGNQPAYPTAKVTGTFGSGFRFSLNNGGFVEFKGSVLAGQTAEVDFRQGRVRVNGVDQSWLIGNRKWSPVQPGKSVSGSLVSLQTGGAGQATIELRDTWA